MLVWGLELLGFCLLDGMLSWVGYRALFLWGWSGVLGINFFLINSSISYISRSGLSSANTALTCSSKSGGGPYPFSHTWVPGAT